jgi:hypothetical protein
MAYLSAMGGGCGVLRLAPSQNIRRRTERNVDVLFQIFSKKYKPSAYKSIM